MTAARTLGIIGLTVSGLYLLLVAIANLAAFTAALQLRRQLQRNPQLPITLEDLMPRGPAARAMTAPLRRVKPVSVKSSETVRWSGVL